MKNRLNIILGILMLIIFSQCQKTETVQEPVDNDEDVFDELFGNEYLFTITEFENAEVTNSENEKYIVQFSEDGSDIDFIDNYLYGSFVDKDVNSESYERFLEDFDKDQVIVYNLNDSTFAGGKLIIWYENNSFYGQLTIFGSGVPVIYKVKGDLSAYK